MVGFVISKLCKHVKYFRDSVRKEKQAMCHILKKQIQVYNELHSWHCIILHVMSEHWS